MWINTSAEIDAVRAALAQSVPGSDGYADQSSAVKRTLESSRRASDLAQKRFDAGYVGYIDVIDSQRTELSAEREAARVAGLRYVNAVQLVKALGGGWNDQVPSPDVSQ